MANIRPKRVGGTEVRCLKRKYHNKVTFVNGIRFDSQAEALRYGELKLMQTAGIISNLALQPVFELQAAFTDRDGQRVQAITYRADFSYTHDGQRVVEDVKGAQTKDFRIKWKMARARYPEIIWLLSGVGRDV